MIRVKILTFQIPTFVDRVEKRSSFTLLCMIVIQKLFFQGFYVKNEVEISCFPGLLS